MSSLSNHVILADLLASVLLRPGRLDKLLYVRIAAASYQVINWVSRDHCRITRFSTSVWQVLLTVSSLSNHVVLADLLDSALLRPGELNTLLYISVAGAARYVMVQVQHVLRLRDHHGVS